MAGGMMLRRLITSDLAVVFWQPSRMASSFISVATAPRWAAAIICILLSAISSLHAEDLPDPTRPPSSIFSPAVGVGIGREAAESRASGLHTIIISDTRRAAIINGQTVELGGEYGNARLIEVNEGGVVLQRAQSRQVLTLFPDVKMTRKASSDKKPAELGKESAEKKSPNE
jgi:MSHA biogenesis protein MshK